MSGWQVTCGPGAAAAVVGVAAEAAGRGGGVGPARRRWRWCAPEWWCIEEWRWRITQRCFPYAVDVAAVVLRTLRDRVAAKLQTIGRRWAICRHPEVARLRGPEIGPARAMSPIDRTRALGPAEATSPIGRTLVSLALVIDQAPVQDRSPDRDRPRVHDHRHAMCKTFSICQMPEVEMSAAADHQVDSATLLQLPVARSPAARRPSS